MKKYFVIAILAVIATSSYYCTKRTSEATIERQSNEPQLDKAALGSSCNCAANQTSCSASCLFSDCCVCYDPKRETGSCGCYFGIAKCMTAAIGASSNSTGSKTIHFYYDRFDNYMNYLKKFGKSTTELVSSSNRMARVGQLKTSEKGEFVVVSSKDYQEFFDAYESYINSLSVAEQSELTAYLNTLK